MRKTHLITILAILLVLVSGCAQISHSNDKNEYYAGTRKGTDTQEAIIHDAIIEEAKKAKTEDNQELPISNIMRH